MTRNKINNAATNSFSTRIIWMASRRTMKHSCEYGIFLKSDQPKCSSNTYTFGCTGHNVITPVIVKMRALWLVKYYVISRYNYLAWGKYSVGAEFQNGCLAFCQCYRGSIPELNQNYTRANLNSIKSSSPTPVTRKRSDFPWHHIFRDLLSAHWNPPSLQPIFCHPWKSEQAGLFSNFY